MVEPDDQGVLELGSPIQEPRRVRVPLVVGTVVVLLAALAIVVLPAGESGEVVVDEEATPTTRGPQPPDPGSFPAPMALGGPTDGKESVGLPVKAEPATGLRDGQAVEVTGTGFPPGVSVGIVMCAKEAGRDHGAQGVAACNIGHYASVTSDADGVATGTFSVRRLLVLAGNEIDCASEPGRCMVAMGMISDYDTSGGVLVDFDPSAPLPEPPTVTVDATDDLRDGQQVAVEVQGLYPDGMAGVMLCDEGGQRCLEVGSAEVDAEGRATVTGRVWRTFGVMAFDPEEPDPNVDCAVDACHLQVWGEAPGGRQVPPVPLAFDPSEVVDREPPLIRLLTEGPYGPGDEIEVEVLDVPRHTSADLVLCSPDGPCTGGPSDFEETDDGVRTRVEVLSAADGNPCMGPCTLWINLHAPPDPGGAPLLLPPPIPIEVTR